MSDTTLAAIVADHFTFLCSSENDKKRLEAMARKVTSFERHDDGAVTFSIGNETIDCAPPFTGEMHEATPQSYGELARHHNGITWESIGGGPMGFLGLTEQGEPWGLYGFDLDDIEEGDWEEFIKALKARGKSLDDLQESYDCGQNWLFFDPLRQNALQEPALAFVSHESLEWEPVQSADTLSAAGITLALMAYYFLDDDLLDEIYT